MFCIIDLALKVALIVTLTDKPNKSVKGTRRPLAVLKFSFYQGWVASFKSCRRRAPYRNVRYSNSLTMADIQSFISALKRSTKVSVSLPFLRYEIDLAQAIDPKTVDERIARLDQISNDLNAAVEAVAELQREAQNNKKEAEELREAVEQLEQDKVTAETLLQVPEESFSRILARANAKARTRGLIEGSIIGFTTGALSSLLVWYLTK